MSDLEMKIEALIRCVGTEAYEKAMTEIQNAESPNPDPFPPVDIDADIENVVQKILVELGVPTHVKGYRYISTALRMSVEKPDIMDAMTKELYPGVAEVYETTWHRVERAIRHAVELAWDRCDLDVRYKYFGNTISNLRCKPTNSEFLTMTAIIVKQRMKNRG